MITDAALFADDPAAADLVGYGPVPGDLVRDLLTPTAGTDRQQGGQEGGEQAAAGVSTGAPAPTTG